MGKAIRDAYGEAMLKYGKDNDRVIVLDADVSGSTKSAVFGKEVPERFLNVGIAESNMTAMAAGLATAGMIPFVNTFAVFIVTNGLLAAREMIAYNNLDVKLMGAYGGLSDSYDGPTHHSIEDMAIMRSLPNMKVLCPCDASQTEQLVRMAVEKEGPMYIRLSRDEMPDVYKEDETFEIGKGRVLLEGGDAVVFACGLMVGFALEAAKKLALQGIYVSVADMYSVKPIDRELVRELAEKTEAVVTAEEHSIYGGLGSAVAEVIAREGIPAVCESVGVQDCFAECGAYADLLEKYHLDADAIEEAVRKAIGRKRGRK